MASLKLAVTRDHEKKLKRKEMVLKNISPDKACADPHGLHLTSGIRHSLRLNILSNAAANFIKGGCQMGLVIILAKLGSKELVGQYGLGMAVAWPVFLLADLQLRVIQATDAKNDFHFGHYLGLRLLTTPLAFLIVLGTVWILGYRWETSLIVMGVALSRAVDSIRDCIHGAMQRHERLDLVSFSMIIRNTVSLLIFTSVFFFSGFLLLAVLSQTIIGILVLLFFDLSQGAILPGMGKGIWMPRFDWRVLARLIRLALPLGLITMIISINSNFPRYLLEKYLGEGMVGIFTALSQPPLAGGMVMAALGHASMPRMAKVFALGDLGYLTKLVWRLMGMGAFLGVLMLMVVLGWGRQIVALVYGPEYAEHQLVLLWLTAAGGIGYLGSGLGYGLNATRAYNVYLIFYTISSGLGIILGMVLIPKYGLLGAAWTVCSTNFFNCLFLAWLFLALKRKKGQHAARI